MKGFEAYKKYLAVRMHFNPKTDYDYFKYNGKTTAKLDSFLKDKKNIYKYGGLEKRIGLDELETLFFINIESNPFSPFVPQIWYKRYKNEMERFKDYFINGNGFQTDLDCILSMCKHKGYSYDSLFNESKNHLHPMLYVWYDKGIISEYTFYFIDLYINRFVVEESSSDPLLWKEVVDKHSLRKPFYKRCYFSRLQSKDEMIEKWTKNIKSNLG